MGKIKDFMLSEEPIEEQEKEVSREDVLVYIDGLTAQEMEYNITVRNPIDLKLTVIRLMLDVLSVPFASLSTGEDKPYVDESVRKEANALMKKFIKQVSKEFDDKE